MSELNSAELEDDFLKLMKFYSLTPIQNASEIWNSYLGSFGIIQS